MTQIKDDNASYGTVNTPKGRIYGLFLIARIENGYLLRLHRSTADHVIESLSKYKVFFKCDMLLSDKWHAFGHYEQTQALSPYSLAREQHSINIRLPGSEPSYEKWEYDSTEGPEDSDALAKWDCIQSLNGIPELYAETADKFILQYLNLQNLNAVSFNKGCYTGQEIIARMKFLGKLKKKTFLLTSSQAVIRTPGQTIFDADGKKCGELVRTHWHQDHGAVALGILDISYSENTRPVFLDDDATHPFTVSEIVYN